MTIFDDIPRDDSLPPLPHETAFAYLNSSGRAEAARVRQLVDGWFEAYPDGHRDALVARFRSPIDDQHNSAFFELFVYTTVIANGHKVAAVEPKLAHTERSPDFLVEAKDGGQLYLECVIATGRSHTEVAAQARLNQVLAAIDRTTSPAHFLDLSVEGTPDAPISIKAMRRALKAWIAELPEGDAALEATPFVHEENGMRLMLRAFPRHNRQRAERAIGVRFFPPRLSTDEDDIRAAIKRKAERYGPLDQPYAVAVNAMALFTRESHAVDALVGTEHLALSRTQTGEYEPQHGRNPDGIWWGQNGPCRQGLAAVFSTEQVNPWNFATGRGRIIRNPWASTPIPRFCLGGDEFWPEEGAFRITEGANFGRVLGLPDGWPGV